MNLITLVSGLTVLKITIWTSCLKFPLESYSDPSVRKIPPPWFRCGRTHPEGGGHPRVRLPPGRTKPLRGGKDPGLVHKPLASATRPIASDFVPCLYQRAASCYSPAWFCLGRVWPLFFHFAVVEHSTQNTPFAHLFNLLLKAKAVPVAASSSAFVSAGPTGPELRPRSSTALRIQDSSKRRDRFHGALPRSGPRRRTSRFGQAFGENARRIGRRREAQRVRLPRPTTHQSALKAVGSWPV